MGFAFNQGGTPLTRLATNDTPNSFGNVANKSFTVCARFASSDFSAARFLWSTLDQSNFVNYFAVEVANSTTLKVRIPRAGGDSTHELTVPAMTASTSTFYDLVMLVEVDATANERYVTAYFRATSAGSAGFFQGAEEPLTDDGLGSGAELSGTGVFYWGNDGSDGDGASRGFVGNATDLALFEGTLSAQDIENFGKGWSPLQFTSATLRSCPMNVAGTALDVLPGATVALTVGGTAQFTSEAGLWDGPRTDTTGELGYVTDSHLVSISVGTAARPTLGYDTATATGNVRCIIDESGHGNQCRNTTANTRFRFGIDPRSADRRMASSFCASGSSPSWMFFNTSATGHIFPNRAISIGMVHAKNVCNVEATDNKISTVCKVGAGAAIMLCTDAQGNIAVRINGVSTVTPLLASGKGVRAQSKPMAYILTVSSGATGTNGVSESHTFTLYSNDGTATVTETYTNNNFGTVQWLGPDATGSSRGQYGVYKGFDVWTKVLSAAEAAQQLTAYNSRFGLPMTYAGVLVRTGDSLVEGSFVDRGLCDTALYQMPIDGRIRCIGQGYVNTTIASHRLTVTSGTGFTTATYANRTFVDGATVTQGSAEAKILYRNGNTLYLYDWNGVAFTVGPNLVQGATSSAVATISSTDPANAVFNKLAATNRASVMVTALNEFTGQRVAWFWASTNAIGSTWAGADVVECDKAFAAYLYTNCSGIKVFVSTAIPRGGVAGDVTTLGPNLQTYNTALLAAASSFDGVPNHSTHVEYDYKDGSLNADNGAVDVVNTLVYQADDSGTAIDYTHINGYGNYLIAIDGAASFAASFSASLGVTGAGLFVGSFFDDDEEF